MKNAIFITCMLLSFSLFAQNNSIRNNNELNTGVSLGLGFTSIGGNSYGMGAYLSSPVWGDFFVLDLTANIHSVQFTPSNDTVMHWYNVAPIFVGFKFGGIINENLRVYYGMGANLLFTNKELSKKKLQYGGYVKGTFEYNFNEMIVLFIETGLTEGLQDAKLYGMDGFRADKVPGSPFLSNGFLTSMGIRIYL